MIQEKKFTKDHLRTMPKAIVDRIQWLSEIKLLAQESEQIAMIQKAYTILLIWAEIAQKNFEINGETTTTMSTEDLKEVATVINEFCSQI